MSIDRKKLSYNIGEPTKKHIESLAQNNGVSFSEMMTAVIDLGIEAFRESENPSDPNDYMSDNDEMLSSEIQIPERIYDSIFKLANGWNINPEAFFHILLYEGLDGLNDKKSDEIRLMISMANSLEIRDL